ncbi:Ig-like domain-containing protein [Bacillus sp. CECT 9360]|uniref:Ig-like domain-containing protein n=1 Tax=Bacillus sp. CECT 9360 TaxID=2845821 RepID=UPI001E3FA10E|nr:Ig-like domain-containing protein [Bacillus sp. CECT 9360]CAH0345137.1 hypothetical protein BCI9360_01416 [Bacillus sp. CECT 9360]
MKKLGTLFLAIIFLFAFGNSHDVLANSSTYDSIRKAMIDSQKSKKPIKKASITKKNFSVKAYADEEYLTEKEPNNDYHNANELPLDTFMTGSFTPYDIDRYTVTVPESGTLVLIGATNYSDPIELGFGLIDENDEWIEMDDMLEEDGARLLAYHLEPGTYNVVALDLANYASGAPYVLSASMAEGGGSDIPVLMKPIVNPVDDNDTQVTGKADPGSYVWVQVNDDYVNDGTLVKANGTFSVKIKPQRAGTYIAVTTTDDDDNQSEYTELYVIDKTPPRALSVNTVTTKTKSVTGKTEAKMIVEVKLGSKLLGKATADSKGNYKVTIKPQKKGSKLTINAIDSAKNRKSITTSVK